MGNTTADTVMALIDTTSSRVKDLTIKNGQLIFIQDLGRIAFDFKNKRIFYNQIVELNTEGDRVTLDNPISGYYFVIDTATLWFYQDEWVQITEKPEEVVFIGVELPELGQAKENALYVNKMEREIAVFDSALNEYVIVSNYTKEATVEEIEDLFE